MMLMRPELLRAARLMLRKFKATRKMWKVKKKAEQMMREGPLRKKPVVDGVLSYY
jgi:hypothetical protein